MTRIIHATVPFPMLAEPETAPLLAAAGVGPEIYLAGNVLDGLRPGEADRAAGTLRAAGIATSTFHAPFEEINPGARDQEARRLATRRMLQTVALAPVFRPLGIVMHGGYYEWLYDFEPRRWLAEATRTFGEVAEAAERAGVDLFLENVFDEVPDHLQALRDAVGSPRLGFCFDAGHATLFSRLPAHKWIEALAPRLREMHLHDNRGRRDDHLPLGEGSINFRGVLLAAADAGTEPILTLEPHRKEHFHRTTAALKSILAGLPAS